MSTLAPQAPAAPPAAAERRRDADSGVRETWKNAAGYAAAALVTVAAAAIALQLWRADLGVPLWYGGDNLMSQMFAQDVLESGWIYDNGRLGAPG